MRRPAPRRVAVIGNAGTGKSTLAAEIGGILGVDVIHLDRLLWKPGWRIIDEEVFRDRHNELIARDSWVIDGVAYLSTIEARLKRADVVVFTRYALWRCYWWSIKRELQGGSAAGRPDGCAMLPAAAKLVRAIWRTQRETLPEVEQMIERHRLETQIYVLRSPRDLPKLMKEVSRRN